LHNNPAANHAVGWNGRLTILIKNLISPCKWDYQRYHMTQLEEKALVEKYNRIGIVITEIEDFYRGKGWNKYLLNEWIIYKRISCDGWVKARLFDGCHVDHTDHATLEEAFLSAHKSLLEKQLAYFEGKNIDEKHLRSIGFKIK